MGSCLSEFGICTRPDGQLETLLFEVTPRASEPVYGGARYVTLQNVAEAPARGARIELNVPPRVSVSGRVLAAPELASCSLLASRTTLPVSLTFTPREQLLGLNVPSYETQSRFDYSPNVREWLFVGSVPPGHYDVYMRLDGTQISEECPAVPQIFRDRSVGLLQGADDRLELQQPRPFSLRLIISWEDSLDGWRLDMVHPVTGEVLSNRVTLRASDADMASKTLITTLNYSRADEDFIAEGSELVRLSPPDGMAAGTVLLDRTGVELSTPGEGAIGNVSSFGKAVDFQAWVWKEGDYDRPLPGVVNFAAIELDEVETGTQTAFEVDAPVDATGQVKARLLPGTYRVRVTPGVEEPGAATVTSFEDTITVWPNGTPELDQQGGHVIDVPPPKTLGGRVVAELNRMPLRHVEVRASASNPTRDLCGGASADAGMPACFKPPAPVLQRARANDPFVPRTRSALTEDDGSFTLDGLDCGRCDAESPVYFDLRVRPDVSTGMPWVVRSGVDPDTDTTTFVDTPLVVPMPVARPMRVTYGEPPRGPEGGDAGAAVGNNLSGALVRVFALLDGHGQLVNHPEGLPPCISMSALDASACVQSVLQVAEARTDSEGQFLLLLPPDLE